MSRQDEHTPERRLQWSASMDGEGDAPAVEQLCAAWRDDAELRGRWHAWHLIGDVMRSEDLSVAPGRDARFLASLRAQLATEPVVLAPAPIEPMARRAPRRRWAPAAAVAAGFAAVVGTAVVMDIGTSGDAQPTLAAGQPGAAVAPVAVSVAAPRVDVPAEPQFVAADGQLIRSARLDRYLAAHKPVGGGRALVMPSSFAPQDAAAGR